MSDAFGYTLWLYFDGLNPSAISRVVVHHLVTVVTLVQ